MLRRTMLTASAVCIYCVAFPAFAMEGLYPLIDLSAPSSKTGVLRMYGNYPGGIAGISVSSGDFNGDGVEDVALGAQRSSPQERDLAGEAYVVFGAKRLRGEDIVDLNDPPPGVLRIHGAETGMELGRSVATGDMDGDGIEDLIISAMFASPLERMRAGMLYIIFGSPSLYSEGVIDLRESRPDVALAYGREANEELGILIYAGDVNGDGFYDAIAGAMSADPLGRYGAGKAYVIFGSADIRSAGPIDARNRSRVLVIDGERPGDGLGYHVTAGDLNADGIDEIIVGSRHADPLNRDQAGIAYIIFGDSGLQARGEIDLAASQPNVLRIFGAKPGDNAGDRMNVGDIDGDGTGDVLIGAAGCALADGIDAGRVYVVFGAADMHLRKTIDMSRPDWDIVSIIGENAGDFLTMPFSGDVNGDGIDDITVMAHSAAFGNRRTGGGYAIFGTRAFRSMQTIDLRNPQVGIVRIQGEDIGGYFGVSGDAGDVNGDGYEDLIMAAHAASPEGRSVAGKVYVVWGGPYRESGDELMHFSFNADTGDSATVTLRNDSPPWVYGNPIAKGDEIGIFTPAGICAGAGVWTDSDLSITIWGDDKNTFQTDGFRKGEPLSFRIWKLKENREYAAAPIYATSVAAYWSGAVFELTSLNAAGAPAAAAEERPRTVSLAQNIPNPFNPSTTVAFTLPKASRITLTVYNTLGAKVAALAEGDFAPGEHRVVWNARDHAGGVYFCRLDADGCLETRKMLLVK